MTTDGTSSPRLWLDHVVYGVPDVSAATDRVAADWGVAPTVGGSHVGRGTRNVLLALGGQTYLEIIGPDEDQPQPENARPFGVDGLEPGSSGRLVGFALGTDDIEATVASAVAAGFDPGPIASMVRAKPDGTELHWRLTFSAAAATTRPFFIDWGTSTSPAVDSAQGCTIRGLSVRTADPAVAEVLGRVTGVDVSVSDSESLRLTLNTPAGERELDS